MVNTLYGGAGLIVADSFANGERTVEIPAGGELILTTNPDFAKKGTHEKVGSSSSRQPFSIGVNSSHEGEGIL